MTPDARPAPPMQAARARRAHPGDVRLLVMDPVSGRIAERAFATLPALLRRGDLVVVNDAGTRPSSLALTTAAGEPVEARLHMDAADDDGERAAFSAVLFGPGDWRMDTDARPAPPRVRAGDVLTARDAAGTAVGTATVVSVADLSLRLVRLRVDDALARALFRLAAPVQYSYMGDALALGDVQTPYASRPWASEMPSAGRSLSVGVLVELRRRGVEIARVTAAAGLSATGDPALDRLLPFPEPYEVPPDTVAALARTQARGGRVIAVGTSTVRALESAAVDGAVRAGRAMATLILGPAYAPRVVDAIVSGMHESGTSHDAVLRAFAPGEIVDRAIATGRAHGLLVHELGDHCIVLPGALPSPRTRVLDAGALATTR